MRDMANSAGERLLLRHQDKEFPPAAFLKLLAITFDPLAKAYLLLRCFQDIKDGSGAGASLRVLASGDMSPQATRSWEPHPMFRRGRETYQDEAPLMGLRRCPQNECSRMMIPILRAKHYCTRSPWGEGYGEHSTRSQARPRETQFVACHRMALTVVW